MALYINGDDSFSTEELGKIGIILSTLAKIGWNLSGDTYLERNNQEVFVKTLDDYEFRFLVKHRHEISESSIRVEYDSKILPKPVKSDLNRIKSVEKIRGWSDSLEKKYSF